MNICYFVNQYPKVSHTFIRREILALEKLGAKVTRIAARNNPEELVDATDISELDKTQCIASTNKGKLLSSGFDVFIEKPFLFIKVVATALSLGFYDNCRFIKNLIYLLEACRLLMICRQEDVQHVHAHFGTNSTSVVFMCRLLGGPKYSFTVHGPEEFDKPLQISLSKKIYHSDFVVAITSYCRSQLFRWSAFKHWDKVKEVHCAVDEEMTEKSAMPITASNVFVSIGRLCEQKGQMLMLKALAALKSKGVEFELHLVGDGELRAEVEAFVKQEGLDENVHLLGWQSSEQIVDLLDQSTALLLPSFAEGLPVVIMEAYARSRPVLSTYIAGIPELVDEDSGWLVPAGNVSLLSEKIQSVIDTPISQLELLGRNGREKVVLRHSSDVEAEKLLRFASENFSS